MTKPPIESVPTLAGRELDAAVHEFVMTRGHVIDRKGGIEFFDWSEMAVPPNYYTDFRHLEAMIAAVRAKGWWVRISEVLSGEMILWQVSLICAASGRVVVATGDTLPLAFARAALLTTYGVATTGMGWR